MTTTATDQAPRLGDLFDPRDMFREIENGYVVRKQHPTLPLSIHTYTRAAQYDRRWNPVTIACRGLITNFSETIVARPFPKFFNVAEHELGHDYAPPLPQDEPFQVFDKVDGSLGIVFHFDGRWHVASKGSFISEQAVWAQRWLDEHPRHTQHLVPGLTYLAEIVYPENRIVVDNGDERTLVLLAVMRPDGTEEPLAEHRDAWWATGGRVVQCWNTPPLAQLVRMAAANEKLDGTAATGSDAEGWVIRYASGLRAKVKFSEYVRLHRVLTGITARDIWRALAVQTTPTWVQTKRLAQALHTSEQEIDALRATGRPFDALLENVPDEFDAWVRGIAADLTAKKGELEAEIDAAYAGLRKDFAAKANAHRPEVRAGLFLKLDGRGLETHLWREAQPDALAPFRDDVEG
jgi:RNA ligase